MLEYKLIKPLIAASGLALLLGSSGVVMAEEPKKEMIRFVAHNGKDYECFTETREYAANHPCYKEVQRYLEEKRKAAEVPTPPPSPVYRTPEIIERYTRDFSMSDLRGSSAKSGGHKECHKK